MSGRGCDVGLSSLTQFTLVHLDSDFFLISRPLFYEQMCGLEISCLSIHEQIPPFTGDFFTGRLYRVIGLPTFSMAYGGMKSTVFLISRWCSACGGRAGVLLSEQAVPCCKNRRCDDTSNHDACDRSRREPSGASVWLCANSITKPITRVLRLVLADPRLALVVCPHRTSRTPP
jgi:hypothetical protein